MVFTDNHGVVSLEGLKSELFLRSDTLFSQLGNFSCEDSFRCCCTVDAVGLDGDDDTTANLEELVCIQPDDTSLIWLGDVSEDAVDHADKHAVLERMSCVFDDGNDVGAVSSHINEIATGTVRELDCEDSACRTDNVSDVRD